VLRLTNKRACLRFYQHEIIRPKPSAWPFLIIIIIRRRRRRRRRRRGGGGGGGGGGASLTVLALLFRVDKI